MWLAYQFSPVPELEIARGLFAVSNAIDDIFALQYTCELWLDINILKLFHI